MFEKGVNDNQMGAGFTVCDQSPQDIGITRSVPISHAYDCSKYHDYVSYYSSLSSPARSQASDILYKFLMKTKTHVHISNTETLTKMTQANSIQTPLTSTSTASD